MLNGLHSLDERVFYFIFTDLSLYYYTRMYSNPNGARPCHLFELHGVAFSN